MTVRADSLPRLDKRPQTRPHSDASENEAKTSSTSVEVEHYSDWLALTAGRIVEEDPTLDGIIDTLAVAQDHEYQFEGDLRDVFAQYLLGDNELRLWLSSVAGAHGASIPDWTYASDPDTVRDALVHDLGQELVDFVQARHTARGGE